MCIYGTSETNIITWSHVLILYQYGLKQVDIRYWVRYCAICDIHTYKVYVMNFRGYLFWHQRKWGMLKHFYWRWRTYSLSSIKISCVDIFPLSRTRNRSNRRTGISAFDFVRSWIDKDVWQMEVKIFSEENTVYQADFKMIRFKREAC